MKLQISLKKHKGKRTLNGNFIAGYLQIVFDSQTKQVSEAQNTATYKKTVKTLLDLHQDANVVAAILEQNSTQKKQADTKNEANNKKEVPKQDARFRLELSRNDIAVLNGRGFLGGQAATGKKSEFILDKGFAIEFWGNPNGHSILNVAFLQENKALLLVSKKISDSKHNLFLNVNEYEKADKKIINGFEVVQIRA